jgi:hypothetical protein
VNGTQRSGFGFGGTTVQGTWGRAMGKRQCELEGCTKWAVSGGTPYCTAHGGGKRCQEERLHQVRCCRRHAKLHRARRGQAVPDGGLLQVRSRRHGAL